MAEKRPELEALRDAVQALSNAIDNEPHLVDQAIVVWESVSFAEDGEPQRMVRYACPTDNFSITGAIGLLEAGTYYVRRDVLHDDGDD